MKDEILLRQMRRLVALLATVAEFYDGDLRHAYFYNNSVHAVIRQLRIFAKSERFRRLAYRCARDSRVEWGKEIWGVITQGNLRETIRHHQRCVYGNMSDNSFSYMVDTAIRELARMLVNRYRGITLNAIPPTPDYLMTPHFYAMP